MKVCVVFLVMLWANSAFSQVNDSFTDGNFSSSPEWKGDLSAFTINSGKQLQTLQNALAQTFSLATASSLAINSKWEFFVQLNFDPSANNQVRIYLTSDNENLKGSLNGYFIQIGETGSADSYDLYRQSGTTITRIIDGPVKTRASSNQLIARVQVTRTTSSVWELKTDITGGTNFISEGMVTDNTFTSCAWFGVHCKYTTTNSDKFIFDDFKAELFVTDNIPPKLLSATIIDSLTIEVLFDEPLDSVSAKISSNFSVNNGYNNPVLASTTSDAAKYRLRFLKGFNTGNYTLIAINIKDRNNNSISGDNTATFNYVKPYFAIKNDLVINEIFADPAPQIDLPSVEFIELLNTTNHIIYLKNWKYADASTTITFSSDSIQAGQYLILSAKADTAEFKRFGKVVGISPWPSLNNGSDILKLISPENKVVDSVAYSDIWYRDTSKKQGGWTLERVDPKCLCKGLFNWNASTDVTGGTPGKQNSIYSANYDQRLLITDSIKQLSDSTLKIFFNKHIDAATVQTNKFTLNPGMGNLASVNFNLEYTQASLTYKAQFNPGILYRLTVSGISDCSGNIMTDQSLTFQTASLPHEQPSPPVRLDTAYIYITEIFADPSPEVKLPLSEFVEIYNPGKDTIDLDGWTLNDPVTKASLRKVSILPKEFLILCPAADTTQYKTFGRTIGISPWPSLNNASDQIVLKSFKNRVTDSIAYVDTWYKDAVKKAGGWTLERIDPLSLCKGLFNWSASVDSSGGTPGKKSSIYIAGYDKIPLMADSLKQLSDSTLKIFFNKHIDVSTAQANKFVIDPDAGESPSVSFDTEYRQATLYYHSQFTADTGYRLSVSGISDCAGNITSDQSLMFRTASLPPAVPIPPAPPVRLDTAKIYITEIFADPSPEVKLPLSEFVELYNPGKDTIDLDGWTLNDPSTKVTFRKVRILPKEFLILCPVPDTIQYKAFGRSTGISPWPSLNNASDQIVLKSFKNRVVDSVAYTDTWYKDAVKKAGGWTLERIDPLSLCKGLFNWSASVDSAGGTPGKQNSINIASYDMIPLRADSLKQLSDSTLKIFFNKHIDTSTAQANKFIIDPATGGSPSVSFDTEYKQATLYYHSKFTPRTRYTLSVSGISDCAGNVPTGQILTFQTASLPSVPPAPSVRSDTAKIFITEIFADPSPEVKLPLSEFVELYNPGMDTIDLDGWTLSDPGTKAIIRKFRIFPKEFLILCPVADTTQYKTFGKTIGISPWPSLNNSSDQIVLKSFKNRTVDSVSYSDSWYKDVAKKPGGWTLEKIDPNLINSFYSWAASENSSGGSPGGINSITSLNKNSQTLSIQSISILSDSTLRISLNIVPDTTYIKADYFYLDLAGKATKAILTSNYKQLDLKFARHFEEDKQYILTVDSLRTIAGIRIDPVANQKSFSVPGTSEETYKVLITEVFADPSPQIGLPESEFVELFNYSDAVVHLKGMTYEDATGTKYTFKTGSIDPGGYLIICPEKDTLNYQFFGKVLGISTWPSLNNDKDVLILKNNKAKEFHRVSYNNTWYKNKEKLQGGWSLELIDPQTICSGSQNWIASIDITGGTPGKQNSVYKMYAANAPLKLMKAVIIDSITLQLNFNRSADSLSASNNHNFKLNNGAGSPISVLPVGPDFEQIILKFPSEIVRGSTYLITVTNLMDCSGTAINTYANSAELIYPHKISKNDIVINEILFNPRSGGADFVEIYNRSDKSLDLKDLYLAIRNDKDSLINPKQLSTVQLLMQPHTYRVFTTDSNNIRKEYTVSDPDAIIQIPSLPPLNDDEGAIVLVSGNNRIDQLNYSEKMHFSLIKDPEGVSLERSSFNRSTNEAGNFRSAAASAGYATPGYKNSQYVEDTGLLQEEVYFASKTFSPDNDGFEDLLTLNYNFLQPGMIANASVYTDRGTLIRKLAKNMTLTGKGTINWDGLTETNDLCAIGIYIFYLEVFNLDGTVKKYRKNCVLATKLN